MKCRRRRRAQQTASRDKHSALQYGLPYTPIYSYVYVSSDAHALCQLPGPLKRPACTWQSMELKLGQAFWSPAPCGRRRGRIRQLRWGGPMYHAAAGSLRCCCIGPHHHSGVATEDKPRAPFRHSRSRRAALGYRNAHGYVSVFLQRIKPP